MARHEGKFEAEGETWLDMGELLRALRHAGSEHSRERQAAIACLLSASEGWRKAAKQLGGAFADGGQKTGLTDGKER